MKRNWPILLLALAAVALGVRVQFGTAGLASFGSSGLGGQFSNLPGTDGVYSAANFTGIDLTGATDSAAGIRTMLTAAAATHAPVYFPPGTYKHTVPITLSTANMNIYGASRFTTLFKQTYGGPSWILDTATDHQLTYGSALVGSGNSLNTSVTSQYINLNEGLFNPQVPGLNRLSAFDVEFWYQTPTTFPGAGNSYLLTSEMANPNPTNTGGGGVFGVRDVNATGQVVATFNLSSGLQTLTTSASAITTSTTYDFAIDYDGTTCRLFINGKVAASQACSGTAVESPFETISAPDGRESNWPVGGYHGTAALPGFIDAIQFSKISRHTSNYTPATSKPVADSNTLLIENFETTPVISTQLAHTGVGNEPTIYLLIRGGAPSSFIDGVHLHDMDLCAFGTSDGLFVEGFGGEYDHLNCSIAGFYGLDLSGLNFWQSVHDNVVMGNNTTSVDIYEGGSAAEMISYNNQTSNGVVGIYDKSGTDINPHVEVGSGVTVFPYVCNGHCVYDNPMDDLESGDSAYGAAMFFNANYASSVVNGGELNTVTGRPAVIVAGGNGPVLIGTQITGVISSFFEIFNTPSLPATAINTSESNSASLADTQAHLRYVSTPGCAGSTALSSGSGRVTQSCIDVASICSAADVTTPANAVTLAAPATGSVGATGTGTDVIRVICH